MSNYDVFSAATVLVRRLADQPVRQDVDEISEHTLVDHRAPQHLVPCPTDAGHGQEPAMRSRPSGPGRLASYVPAVYPARPPRPAALERTTEPSLRERIRRWRRRFRIWLLLWRFRCRRWLFGAVPR